MADSVTSACSAKVVTLLSGGMDSTVCAALAVRDSARRTSPLCTSATGSALRSGSRRRFAAICRPAGNPQTARCSVPPFFRAIGGSALTDEGISVPEAGPEIGTEIPVTYVPFRNAHFLSAATSWAEVMGAQRIYIGAVQQDSSGYPDCRPEFYRAFNEAMRTGTRDGAIRIETPLIGLRKSEIVTLGLELGAPFDLTWSCYSREDQACGMCDSCVLRLRAFAAAGARDPIPYLSAAAVPE